MSAKVVLVLIFALIALTGAVSLGVFYWQFQSWPPNIWARRVRRRLGELGRELSELYAEQRRGADAGQLRDEYFRRHLERQSLQGLIEYPGIGAATLDRVHQAGYRTLADAQGARFDELPGIGESRAQDLYAAVRKLCREARSRFDAGACREAQEYRRQLDELRADERERAIARNQEALAVESALEDAEELDVLAREVTFWAFLFHREVPGLTRELMDRPLPIPRVVHPVPTPEPRVRPAPMPPEVPVGSISRVGRPSPQPVVIPTGGGPIPKSAKPIADPFTEPVGPPPHSPPPPTPPPGYQKMRAVVRFAYVVARADGRIAKDERKVIRAYLDSLFGHDPVLVRHIDPLMEQTEAAVPAEAVAVDEILAVTSEADRRELLALAGRIADASGERNRREQEAVTRIAIRLGLEARVAVSGKQSGLSQPLAAKGHDDPGRTVSPPQDPRTLLELGPDVILTTELIRRRYRLLTDRLDPTRLAAHGAEFVRMAQAKKAALRAAAETLLVPFGEPLDPPAAPAPPTDLRHNPDLDDVFGA